jgi:hypothetical protein
MSVPPMLTERELAERWRLKAATLRQHRSREASVLPYVTIGRTVRYRLTDVVAAERRHSK